MKLITRFLFALLLIFLGTNESIAQGAPVDTANIPVWVKMMQDPKANFFQTQRAFNLYWQNRPITPGCGYKPFKRWEYSVRNFVNPQGFIEPFQVQAENFREWESAYNQSHTKRAGICPNGFWKEVGPNYSLNEGVLGRLNAIAFHPTDSNIMYCGAPAGGLWKTTDKGKQWLPLTDSLGTLGISAIIVDPKNPDIIYIGTGDRDARDAADKGVYKSTDGGKTFKVMNNGMGDKLVVKMIINPYNSLNLVAATNRGIYRTVDGGLNWTYGVSAWELKDLDFKPGDFSTIYTTADEYFYRSDDSGKTFTKMTIGNGGIFSNRGAVAVCPKNPSLVYYIRTASGVFEGFYLSRDAGKTFTLKSSTPNIMGREANGLDNAGQAYYNLDITVNPLNGAEVFVGGINVFRSTDSGKTWKIDAHWTGSGGAQQVHADHHVLEYSPVTLHLYSGNDGGFYERKKYNGKWYSFSNGLGIGQVYRVSVGNRRNTILNGYQDNGTKSYAGLGVFNKVNSGDGMDNAFDKSNPSRYFTSSQNGVISRHGYNTEGIISLSIGEEGAWVTPFIMRENAKNTLIAGYRNLWMSKNIDTTLAGYVTWRPLTYSLSSGGKAHKIENSPYEYRKLFFSRDDNKLFRTWNIDVAHPTWDDLTSTLPETGLVEAIECDFLNSPNVYIALNKKVYKSISNGNTWTDYSTGLPGVNVYCLVMDTSKTDGSIYAGTYTGVFYRNNNMSSWIPFYNNLPRAVWIRDLEISYHEKPSSYRLVAGTYGRGTWESPLYNFGNKKPVPRFNATQSVVCVGSTLQVFDESDYTGNLSWEFSDPQGAVFSDYTNAKSINPKIIFTKAGVHYLKLKVENCNGADSITRKFRVYEKVKPATCNITATNPNFGIFEGIEMVSFAKLYNESSDTYYGGVNQDFTCLQLQELNMDSAYELTVAPFSNEYCKAFIDFNNNGLFTDAGEEIMSSPINSIHQQTFQIPKTALVNIPLRMRIISNSTAITGPCMVTSYGQSEDYTVIIKKEHDFTTAYPTVCLNTPVIYQDKSLEVHAKYAWNFGSDASPAIATGMGPHAVVYSKTGKKNVSLVINDSINVSKTGFVNVVNKEKSVFIYKEWAGNLYTFTPAKLTLEFYYWNFGDGVGTSSLTQPTYVYTAQGQFPVKLVTGFKHCPDSSVQVVKTKHVGLPEFTSQLEPRVIPNPSNGHFTLQLGTVKPEDIGLQIKDFLGRTVYETKKQGLPAGEDMELDLRAFKLEPGIYFLSIISASGNYTCKLVIE